MSADLFAEFESFDKPKEKSSPDTGTIPSSKAPFTLGSTASPAPAFQSSAGQWGGLQLDDSPAAWGSLSNTPAQTRPGAISNHDNDDDDDDDAWGDFEVAQETSDPAPPQVSPPITKPSSHHRPTSSTRIVRASTNDFFTTPFNDLTDNPHDSTQTATPSWGRDPWSTPDQKPGPPPISTKQTGPRHSTNKDPNVLFDADDFENRLDNNRDEEDDEFGDFETGISSPNPAAISSNFDLLSLGPSQPAQLPLQPQAPTPELFSGLSAGHGASAYPQPPRSPSFHERNPFPGLSLSTPPREAKEKPNKSRDTPLTAWPSTEKSGSAAASRTDDDWGSFEAFTEEPSKTTVTGNDLDSNWDWDPVETTATKKSSTKKPPVRKTAKRTTVTRETPAASAAKEDIDSSWDWDPVGQKTEESIGGANESMPPINIPPPSILLSIVPELLSEANTKLHRPVGGQPVSLKNRILSDPKTIEFLGSYLTLATVAGRIIAGRKLRWHRDKFLAQSMSISAAGSKGMKLAGVDKAQAGRDNREAGDVVDIWKEHVGRLRSAVAAANSALKEQNAPQMKIPEISETMQVQTSKSALTAPKACIICGLKRDERVAKVDFQVEDSFGEWWAEHWGHTACKRFWLRHEATLRQR